MEWIKDFYKKQFHSLKSSIDTIPLSYFEHEVQKISEQVGKEFSHILELGAGSGKIANELAKQSKHVTAVELVKELANYAKQDSHPNLKILCEDFYTVNINEQFDVLLYLDGFGIGTNDDQLRLLHRIEQWLTDDGCALIDIYQPNYWKKLKNTQMSPTKDTSVLRKYGYDDLNQRMTDTWWHMDSKNDKYTQSLACYTVNEIYALCQKANLQIVAYYPGGAMDFDDWIYHDITTLDNCLSYRIKLKKK